MAVMTYTYIINDDTVWGPANTVGRLYAGMLEAAAQVLGSQTGLGEDIGGMFEVDAGKFSACTQELLSLRAVSSHQYLWMLLDSVLPISIAMLNRAGIPASGQTQPEREYLATVNAMNLPMLEPLKE